MKKIQIFWPLEIDQIVSNFSHPLFECNVGANKDKKRWNINIEQSKKSEKFKFKNLHLDLEILKNNIILFLGKIYRYLSKCDIIKKILVFFSRSSNLF